MLRTDKQVPILKQHPGFNEGIAQLTIQNITYQFFLIW